MIGGHSIIESDPCSNMPVHEVKEVRCYACRPMSEWSIQDVKAAISKLKGFHLTVRNSPRDPNRICGGMKLLD